MATMKTKYRRTYLFIHVSIIFLLMTILDSWFFEVQANWSSLISLIVGFGAGLYLEFETRSQGDTK